MLIIMDFFDKNKFPISQQKNGIKFSVKVIPNASKNEIICTEEGLIKIKITVPPVEGKANTKCIEFLSDILRIPKTSISIVSGQTSKNKTIFIEGDTDILFNKISEIINQAL